MFRPSENLPNAAQSPLRAKTNVSGILVITPYYPAHNRCTERVAGALVSEIAASGDTHFIWAATASNPPPDIEQVDFLPMRGFNFLDKYLGWSWPIWTPRSLRILRRAIEGVDCVWLHDTLTLGSVAAFWMAHKTRKPILLMQHSGGAPQSNFLQRIWHAFIDRVVTRKILKHVRQATFTSDAAAEFYHRRVAFTAPVKIIPNGVDCTLFHPAFAEQRRVMRGRFSLRNDQPVLLFANDFSTENGVMVIRELAKILPEWRFWLVGRGNINPETWFLPNIQVFRDRSGADLAELYQSADLMIAPGYSSSFPLGAQEAMACGLPVMCGTTIAAANPFAKSYLWVADVNPQSAKKTAVIWASKLRSGRRLLPISEPKKELSDLAQSAWEWPVIAGYYAELLQAIVKK